MAINCLFLFVGEELYVSKHVCFGLADFLVGTHRCLTYPSGAWRHFSPDTVTCPKKNTTRGPKFEPAPVYVKIDALVRSATPSPYTILYF